MSRNSGPVYAVRCVNCGSKETIGKHYALVDGNSYSHSIECRRCGRIGAGNSGSEAGTNFIARPQRVGNDGVHTAIAANPDYVWPPAETILLDAGTVRTATETANGLRLEIEHEGNVHQLDVGIQNPLSRSQLLDMVVGTGCGYSLGRVRSWASPRLG